MKKSYNLGCSEARETASTIQSTAFARYLEAALNDLKISEIAEFADHMREFAEGFFDEREKISSNNDNLSKPAPILVFTK